MNNINRHNYEEYFLLYTDNELSAKEKQAVEEFAQQNPDLKTELDFLQQTKLTDIEVVFGHKASLFRTEENSITTANCEEQFLLYVDNELSSDEKNKVETFVLQHPQLQAAFTLLNQTKLEPEVIEFKNKEVLYRKEKERRIVYISWQRMAIAAAFLGLVALVWNVIPSSTKTGNTEVASVSNLGKTVTPSETNSIKTPEVVTPKQELASVETTTQVKKVSSQKSAVIIPSKENNIVAKIQPAEVIKNNNEQKINNDLVATTVQPSNKKEKPTEVAIVPQVNNTVNNTQIASLTTMPEKQNAIIAQHAVYKELNTDEEVNDNNVYVGGIKVNKNKVRGFIKKAGRIFNKPSSEENTVAVANMSIDTRSLK
jgi:tellurite resistance protein